jgi:hypothetical protein
MSLSRFFGIAILFALLLLLPAAPSDLHAQAGGVRTHDWSQTTAAEFAAGETSGIAVAELAGGELRLAPGRATGVYTSPVVTTPFAFNAVAPSWQAALPLGGAMQVEARVWANDEPSPWLPLDVELIAQKGRFFPETPLLVPGGLRFQVRITLTAAPDGGSPILDQIAVTAIDASAGPTTSQAKAATRPGEVGPQAVPQPAIIPRAGWGADESLRYDDDGYLLWPLTYRDVEKIVVHHTVSSNDYDEDEAAGLVRAIYYYHAVSRGWGDIGYNYLADKYGNLYEGRYGGPGVVGGHVYGYNYGSVGIGAVGSYGNTSTSEWPTAATMTALANLSAWEAERSTLHPLESAPFYDTAPPNLAGHRDYPPGTTACPGDYLYVELPSLRAGTWDRIVTYVDEYLVDWLSWNTPPEVLLAGQTYSPTVSARNVGWLTWPQAGVTNAVRLGYHWLDEAGQPVPQPPEDDHRGGLPDDLTFSHSHTFQPALLTTPITPGRYTLAWDMVHEGVDWFHEANAASPLLTATVRITDTPPVTVSGPALDVHGQPVSGAEIALPNWITVTSEADGAFALPGLARAAYTLTARAEGHAALLPAYRLDATGGDATYPFVFTPDDFVDLAVNGDFEDGLSGWTPGGVAAPALTAAAHTGLGAAQLGGGPFSGAVWLSQTVILPANAVSPTLSLLYRASTVGAASDFYAILSQGAETVTHTLPLSPSLWTPFQATLPDDWGGPIELQLRLAQSGAPTTVLIDEVRLGYQGLEAHWLYLPLALKGHAAPRCTEGIVNGGFETDAGWQILETDYPAAYVTTPVHGGARALRAGIEPGGENTYSYSSFQQAVALPTDIGSALLTYWWHPASDDPNDLQYLLLLDDAGGILDSLLWTNADDQTWLSGQADLTEYAGLTLTLRFGAYNDGDGGLTHMIVDDVSLQTCPSP